MPTCSTRPSKSWSLKMKVKVTTMSQYGGRRLRKCTPRLVGRPKLVFILPGLDRRFTSRFFFLKKIYVQHKYSTAFFKMSHRKLNMLGRQVAGKPIDAAILQMVFSEKRASTRIKSMLCVARDHAEVYKKLTRSKLIVGEYLCHLFDRVYHRGITVLTLLIQRRHGSQRARRLNASTLRAEGAQGSSIIPRLNSRSFSRKARPSRRNSRRSVRIK